MPFWKILACVSINPPRSRGGQGGVALWALSQYVGWGLPALTDDEYPKPNKQNLPGNGLRAARV
jgi:hypothetical protein